ncbi:Growth hormone-regulated TBC protein 1 [Pteropus alecto]|uniref:Growth hormone-regulated TBC protein 1 n=1 Tax=Pteropus alecto TaxID=9402 RepID=L5KUL8_PTEAL|nr:Growth hormone-regulated TBC protein 1 [Pteropus alecto]
MRGCKGAGFGGAVSGRVRRWGAGACASLGGVKRYIRKGVPLEHRARVWMGVSGAQAQMDRNPGYYHRLLQGERNDSLEEAIRTDYYSPAMLGLKMDQEVLGELVRTKLPAVAALMDGHGVLWTLVVSRWFICLFVDILPVETVLRIWDCLFNEGSKIIFRVALTLIKQHQAFILEATSVADICEKFKEITKGSFVMECHTFMQKIFSEPGSLSMTTITRLRESCRAKLLVQG